MDDDDVDVKEKELVAPDDGLIRYSFSKLRNQATCSARVFFAEQAKKGLIKEDPALPLVYGSAAHKGIEVATEKGADYALKVAHEYVQKNLFDRFTGKELDGLEEKIKERTELMELCLDNFIKYVYPGLAEEPHETEVMLEAPFRKGIMRGVIDVLKPGGVWKDYKSGAKIPTDRMLMRDPQAVVYYWLAQQCNIEPPKRFDYVYLKGKNVRTITKTYKSGKKVGQSYQSADKDNPLMKFSFPVHQDDDKVRRVWNEWVIPLAIQLENKSYLKNHSDQNCASCSYRTACDSTELPKVIES